MSNLARSGPYLTRAHAQLSIGSDYTGVSYFTSSGSGTGPEVVVTAIASYVAYCEAVGEPVNLTTYRAYAARTPDLPTEEVLERRLGARHLYHLTPTAATGCEGPRSLLHMTAYTYDDECRTWLLRAEASRPADVYRAAARLMRDRVASRTARIALHFGEAEGDTSLVSGG